MTWIIINIAALPSNGHILPSSSNGADPSPSNGAPPSPIEAPLSPNGAPPSDGGGAPDDEVIAEVVDRADILALQR